MQQNITYNPVQDDSKPKYNWDVADQYLQQDGTNVIIKALTIADSDDFTTAQDLLRSAIAKVEQSSAYIEKRLIGIAVHDNLTKALNSMTNSRSYRNGGRAQVSTTATQNSTQSSIYTAPGDVNVFQTNGSRSISNSLTNSVSRRHEPPMPAIDEDEM